MNANFAGPNNPNIIVVVFDSLSQSKLLDTIDQLPTLAKLQKTSMCFSNAYVSSPESGPAQASLFTGLDMAAHGVWTSGVALPDKEQTFSQHFARAGFQTWLVGRRHLAGVSNWTTEHARPFEYDNFEWAHGPLHRSRQNAFLAWLEQAAPEAYANIFPKQPDPDNTKTPSWQRESMEALPDHLSFNHWVGEQVCAQLQNNETTAPFLGVVGFVVGSNLGGEPNADIYTEVLNAHALQQADAALSKILYELEAIGQSENTAVIVTATRGTSSGDQSTNKLIDSEINVPLMISLPNTKAKFVGPIVSTIDIAPTLFAIAGVPPPRRIQGVSLAAEEATLQLRGWALSRQRNPKHVWQSALRTKRWKLVMLHAQPGAETSGNYSLFDLQSDPDEKTDLADSANHQHDLEAMIDLMIDARVALEDRTEPRIASF